MSTTPSRVNWIPLCIAGILLASTSAQALAQRWSIYEEPIQRLAPKAFPDLPAAVRADLERRGCVIPQSQDNPTPNNVVHGSFTGTGGSDWAVMCSIARMSRILVYRAGGSSRVDSLWTKPDDRLRVIQVIDTARMRAVSKGWDYALPKLVDHLGIVDGYMGMGAIFHYYADGKWKRYSLSD